MLLVVVGLGPTVVVRLLSLASAVLLVVVGLGPTVVACRWPERLDYSVVSFFYGFVSAGCLASRQCCRPLSVALAGEWSESEVPAGRALAS